MIKQTLEFTIQKLEKQQEDKRKKLDMEIKRGGRENAKALLDSIMDDELIVKNNKRLLNEV